MVFVSWPDASLTLLTDVMDTLFCLMHVALGIMITTNYLSC